MSVQGAAEYTQLAGIENVSIHRLLVLDEKHLAIRLVPRQLHILRTMAKAS
jgi:UbiD family decarboxylase